MAADWSLDALPTQQPAQLAFRHPHATGRPPSTAQNHADEVRSLPPGPEHGDAPDKARSGDPQRANKSLEAPPDGDHLLCRPDNALAGRGRGFTSSWRAEG